MISKIFFLILSALVFISAAQPATPKEQIEYLHLRKQRAHLLRKLEHVSDRLNMLQRMPSPSNAPFRQ